MNSCWIYELKSNNLKETDKDNFLKTLLSNYPSMSPAYKKEKYVEWMKKSYDDIVKNINFSKFATGIYGLKANNDFYFFILIDKTKENLREYINSKLQDGTTKKDDLVGCYIITLQDEGNWGCLSKKGNFEDIYLESEEQLKTAELFTDLNKAIKKLKELKCSYKTHPGEWLCVQEIKSKCPNSDLYDTEDVDY